MNEYTALTAMNWSLCMGVMWACLCRLRLTSTDTRVAPRAVFVGVFVVAFVSGFRGPLFGVQVQTYWPIILTTCILALLLINIGHWRYRAPLAFQKTTGPMPLEEIKQ